MHDCLDKKAIATKRRLLVFKLGVAVWTSPVIQVLQLPAHAATTFRCESIPINCRYSFEDVGFTNGTNLTITVSVSIAASENLMLSVGIENSNMTTMISTNFGQIATRQYAYTDSVQIGEETLLVTVRIPIGTDFALPDPNYFSPDLSLTQSMNNGESETINLDITGADEALCFQSCSRYF